MKSDTIIATQEAALPALSISTNALNVNASANNNLTFDITSNISWNVNSNESWLTVNKASGKYNATISLLITANSTASPRIAIITVTGFGVTSQTITITQGVSTGIGDISEEDLVLYPSPIKDKLMVSFSKPFLQASITIFSLTGQSVYLSGINTAVTEIDMSNCVAGFYFIKVVSKNNGVLTRKIIKQ